jgi:hypothetical protein
MSGQASAGSSNRDRVLTIVARLAGTHRWSPSKTPNSVLTCQTTCKVTSLGGRRPAGAENVAYLLTVPGRSKPPGRYDVTVRAAKDDGHPPTRRPSRPQPAGQHPAHLRPAGPQLVAERAGFRLVPEQRSGHLNDHALTGCHESMIIVTCTDDRYREPGPCHVTAETGASLLPAGVVRQAVTWVDVAQITMQFLR